MAILVAISDRSHCGTPLGDPWTNFGFFHIAKNDLFWALKLVPNNQNWRFAAILARLACKALFSLIFQCWVRLWCSFVLIPMIMVYFCPMSWPQRSPGGSKGDLLLGFPAKWIIHGILKVTNTEVYPLSGDKLAIFMAISDISHFG